VRCTSTGKPVGVRAKKLEKFVLWLTDVRPVFGWNIRSFDETADYRVGCLSRSCKLRQVSLGSTSYRKGRRRWCQSRHTRMSLHSTSRLSQTLSQWLSALTSSVNVFSTIRNRSSVGRRSASVRSSNVLHRLALACLCCFSYFEETL